MYISKSMVSLLLFPDWELWKTFLFAVQNVILSLLAVAIYDFLKDSLYKCIDNTDAPIVD